MENKLLNYNREPCRTYHWSFLACLQDYGLPQNTRSAQKFWKRNTTSSNQKNERDSHIQAMSGDETFVCSDCGRDIPELNRTIHRLRCKGKTSQENVPCSSTATATSSADEDMDLDAMAMAAAAGTSASTVLVAVATPVTPAMTHPSAPEMREYWECPTCTCHNESDTNTCQACGNFSDMSQGESRESAPATAPSSSAAAAASGWTCEMCTFENNHPGLTCKICGNERMRPPDATVRERLVPDELHLPVGGLPRPPSVEDAETSSHDPFSAVATGAMIGGIFGGFAALLGGNQNRSAMQGALQGAVMGAFGTSLLSDMGATFTTTSSVSGPGGATIRTTRTVPGGARITTVQRIRSVGARQNPRQPDAQILQFEDMLRLMFQAQQRVQGMAADTDGMSYEQLLARFGFGTDSRAADERVINSLQSETLKENSVDADGAANACSICLESLLKGEECTRLSCSHSYHTACINEWLRNVGNCPVCKHAV